MLPVGEPATTPFSKVAMTAGSPVTSSTADINERLEQFLEQLHGSCDPLQLHAMKVVSERPPNRFTLDLALMER